MFIKVEIYRIDSLEQDEDGEGATIKKGDRLGGKTFWLPLTRKWVNRHSEDIVTSLFDHLVNDMKRKYPQGKVFVVVDDDGYIDFELITSDISALATTNIQSSEK